MLRIQDLLWNPQVPPDPPSASPNECCDHTWNTVHNMRKLSSFSSRSFFKDKKRSYWIFAEISWKSKFMTIAYHEILKNCFRNHLGKLDFWINLVKVIMLFSLIRILKIVFFKQRLTKHLTPPDVIKYCCFILKNKENY